MQINTVVDVSRGRIIKGQWESFGKCSNDLAGGRFCLGGWGRRKIRKQII